LGRKSVKENKNLYINTRESLDLSRLDVNMETGISVDRLGRIESGQAKAYQDEILLLSKLYKCPALTNYYCSHDCPIGREYVPAIDKKELSQIVLEILAALNSVNNDKERLIEITADGKITKDEFDDFNKIRVQLASISKSVESLRIWVDEMIANNKIDDSIKDN